MSNNHLTKRSFLLCSLALAACQTTTGQVAQEVAFNNAYDGTYEVYVARVANNTQDIVSDPNQSVGTERQLARLHIVAENGEMRLTGIDDYVGNGPNYNDLQASIDANGVMRFSATANYLTKKRKTNELAFEAQIGDKLLTGQRVALTPGNWENNFAQLVEIRKL